MDRPRIARDRVVVGVFSGDRNREGAARVALAGAEMTNCEAAAAVTLTAPLAPVSELLEVSVAVIVWLAAVLKVIWNVAVPLIKVALAGKTAAGSVLVIWTVPL